MSQVKKSAKSAGIIMVVTLGSKFLGFLREALIASRYGSGSGTDTFFIALSAIALFSGIITQTINTTLIPVLSDVEVHEGKASKKNHFNNFLNTLVVVAILLTGLAFLLAPAIMSIIAKGFEGDQFEQAISMMRVGLPILIISTIVGSYIGYLQTEEKFTEAALTAIPFNFVYIIFLLFIATRFSIMALMVTSVIAEIAKLLVVVPNLKKLEYRYEWIIDLKDKYMKQVIYLIPPVLLSVGISDINNMVDRSMASSLAEGSVSSLKYAATLNNIIHSIFIMAILTVIFPILSKEANAQNYERLKKIIQTSMNIILLIMIPATIGMIILSGPAVKFAYQRGEFGDRAAWMTQTALIAYSVGLVGIGLKALLARIFYALQDTKTPMINSIYALVSNVILNIIFVRFLDHNGLALATSLTTIITAGILLYDLRKKIGPLGLSAMVQSSIKILASSAVMGAVVYLLYNASMTFFAPSRLVELVLVGLTVAVGLLVYLGLLYFFKVEELTFLIDNVKEQIAKRK